ncbi:hypothetical protein Q3G72_010162 [Acer saccharum]|nr:hypothetical protein Q3G72_010162 [Acer saccharum]
MICFSGLHSEEMELCVRDFRVFLMPCLTSVQLLQHVIDKSFGFGTVVEEAQRAINAAHDEAESFDNCMVLSRFIATYATLASRDVDCCLIPESRFIWKDHFSKRQKMAIKLKYIVGNRKTEQGGDKDSVINHLDQPSFLDPKDISRSKTEELSETKLSRH